MRHELHNRIFLLVSLGSFWCLYFYFPIGGDYNSLTSRAEWYFAHSPSDFDDLIFIAFASIAKSLDLDVPLVYSLFILLLLPGSVLRPKVFLFALVLAYYQAVTGYHRQVLALLIMMRAFHSRLILAILLSILAGFAHKSSAMLVPFYFYSRRLFAGYETYFIGFGLFISCLFLELAFAGSAFGHFLKYYIGSSMQSDGSGFRLAAYFLAYLILLNSRSFAKDRFARLFEIFWTFAFFLVVSGFSTAGDRMGLVAIIALIFSGSIANISGLRLGFVGLPVFIMTLFWVALSDHAINQW